MLKFLSATALVTCLLTAPVAAQDTPSVGQRVATVEGAFETGTFQALGAIERMLQGFHKRQIGRGFETFMGFRTRRGLENSLAQLAAREPDSFINIIQTFADDLEAARATLALTDPANATPFVLDLKTVWFDVNDNRQLEPGEDGTEIMRNIAPVRRGFEMPEGPLEVRFDGADHAWLMAYTHVLSAMAEAILAFDPTPVFEELVAAEKTLGNLPTIPNTFDLNAVQAQIAELNTQYEAIQAQIAAIEELRRPLNERRRELNTQIRATEDEAEKSRLRDEEQKLRADLRAPELDAGDLRQSERFLRQQIRSMEAKLPGASANRWQDQMQEPAVIEARNAIYALVKTLGRTPDADHIAKLEAHLRGMLAQNRLFWETVELETDNDREWVPNTNQTNAFGLQVPAEIASGWQTILSDAEAVLDGRLLVPHMLLPSDTGISVKAWFDDPSALDLAGWIHGHDATPYLARGPKITNENWLALQRMTRGNAFAFSVFLN